jgi:uncharacterized RDD family membrane protein YckC
MQPRAAQSAGIPAAAGAALIAGPAIQSRPALGFTAPLDIGWTGPVSAIRVHSAAGAETALTASAFALGHDRYPPQIGLRKKQAVVPGRWITRIEVH